MQYLVLRRSKGELSMKPELEDHSSARRAAKQAIDDAMAHSLEEAEGTKGGVLKETVEQDDCFNKESGEDKDGNKDIDGP